MVVAGAGYAGSDQFFVVVYGLDGINEKVKNWRLLIGVLPGLKRLTPVSVAIDQLLCFPDPLTPAKRLFVKQYPEVVPFGNLLHYIHQQ